MLICEGYKMFGGTAHIKPTNPAFEEQDVEGVFLYKPEYDCWYGNGVSYPSGIFNVKEDTTRYGKE